MPSEGRGRKTGNPVLRLPGRHGKKGCLAGNITMKSWRTEDDVPAAVASENGRVWLYCLAPKRDGKSNIFSVVSVEQPEILSCQQKQKGKVEQINYMI